MEQQAQPKKSNLTYTEMLKKLDNFYIQKEELEDKIEQLKIDIEFLETLIMYRYTKDDIKRKRQQWHH